MEGYRAPKGRGNIPFTHTLMKKHLIKNVCHWSDTQVSPPLTYIFLLSVFFRVVLREGYVPSPFGSPVFALGPWMRGIHPKM